MPNVFFAPLCSLLLGQLSFPGMWSPFGPQASCLAKTRISTLLSSIQSIRWGSERDQTEQKLSLQLKPQIICHNLGNVLAKGQRKQPLNPVASPLAPWSGSSLTPLLVSGQISVFPPSALPSLQHCPHRLNPSPPAAPLTCIGAGTINHSLNQHLTEVMAMSVNKVWGFEREHGSSR